MFRQLLRGYSCQSVNNCKTFFHLFPKTYPTGEIKWDVDLKTLRKEYRKLQSQYHPDIVAPGEQDISSELNKAYNTLTKPLTRSQYILSLKGVDLTRDGEAQKIMSKDPQLLMEVLDVHEQLEDISSEDDLRDIGRENKQRLQNCEELLGEAYCAKDYEKAAMLTVELKYWTNLDSAIKEWEPGRPVRLTH